MAFASSAPSTMARRFGSILAGAGLLAATASCRIVIDLDDKEVTPATTSTTTSASTGATASSSSGCAGPECDGGTEPCSDHLQTDPLNCAVCGRVCEAEPCQDGMCAPVAVADVRTVGGLTAFGGFVYWTESDPNGQPPHSVKRLDARTKQSETVFESQSAAFAIPTDVAADALFVYWTARDAGALYRVDAGQLGLDETNVSPLSQLVQPTHVAIGGDAVYVTMDAAIGDGGGVARIDAAGRTTRFAEENHPLTVAAHGSSVYWSFHQSLGDQRVWHATDAAGVATDLWFEPAGAARSIAADESGTYFHWRFTLQQVRHMPPDGDGYTILGGEQFDAPAIAIDDERIYWLVRMSDGPEWPYARLESRRKADGGSGRRLAVDQHIGAGVTADVPLAVDDSSVYWVADGKLWRTAK